jgi:hypothetical protein
MRWRGQLWRKIDDGEGELTRLEKEQNFDFAESHLCRTACFRKASNLQASSWTSCQNGEHSLAYSPTPTDNGHFEPGEILVQQHLWLKICLRGLAVE